MVSGLISKKIYANWFDYRYIFCREKNLYFPTIWRSWLRWYRVWTYKTQYLFRSLATFVSDELHVFHEIRTKSGYPATLKYLEEKLEEMISLINKSEERFSQYLSNVSPKDKLNICKAVSKTEGFLNFLERKCFDAQVYDRMNPDYPEDVLSEHINFLNQGIIVTDNIPNPFKLLHSIRLKYMSLSKEVPLKTSAAVILSLWNAYVKKYNR